jgi:hypothetical protein
MRYNCLDMADPFELYHKELAQSDWDPKIIERYQQITTSYQKRLWCREEGIKTSFWCLAIEVKKKRIAKPCN